MQGEKNLRNNYAYTFKINVYIVKQNVSSECGDNFQQVHVFFKNLALNTSEHFLTLNIRNFILEHRI